MLFKGHPEMILGINFALPPGYKMEVGAVGNPIDGDSVVDDGHGIIVHTPAGRHRVGDHGLVPVTFPTTCSQSSSPSTAPRRHDAKQSAGRRPTQRGRGRGRSRVTAETTSSPSTSSTHAPRNDTQSIGRKPTQPRGRKRAGAAAKNPSAAKKSRQFVEAVEDELQRHIRTLGLPFRFRDPTLGDDNCWFNACCDQVNI